ncbi:phosphotransferase [Kineosporia babensis]|uniref:Aminoglycoside phosphotransferase family protein n=1 Tax=Kineosporia babensis TaxID=499548 RepID=A0A9X1N9Y0_9ACTN|nr:phosphotransferase [Kineosporia babensis]MCD5310253.1 aminoglycoside phosphotransferase family protein [Kineosporia babensis]
MHSDRIADTRAWARSVLGPVELLELKVRPWAVTWQAGPAFVKASTVHTGHEAAVLQVLTRACPQLVPDLIAADPPHHRLIVASAGTVLRELHSGEKFDLAVWIPLVQQFAQLQRAVMPYVDELLAQGVPDERPHRHLDLLQDFVTAPQLPPAERDRLARIAEKWDAGRQWLVPPSLQHGDLHDNNVAVDAAGVSRFFDFGDSSVAHPFSTMDLPLSFAQEDKVDTRRLEDAYLEVFTDLAPLSELRAELQAVIAVAPLQRARNWLRALSTDTPGVAWDPKAAQEWDHPIEYWLNCLR